MNKIIHCNNSELTFQLDECKRLDIPFVRIVDKIRYSKIEFDISVMLEGSYPSDYFRELYNNYFHYFQLPKEQYHFYGGDIGLTFTVKKKHSTFIANQLFEFLNTYTKLNRENNDKI